MDHPNIVFIMADQQRFDTLTVNGNPNMKTPVLDALARSGANLHGYFANTPVCVPSRCTLFTGRYPHSHGARENYSLLEAGRELHLFRILKQAGYRIGYCGKNHLVDDLEKPNFDWFDERGSDLPAPEEKTLLDSYWNWRKNESGVLPGSSAAAWRAGWVHNLPPETTRTYQTAQAGIEFLQQQTPGQPFALCISFEDPHVPHIAMQEYFDKYPLDQIELEPDGGDAELAEKAKRWLIKKGAQVADDATEADKKRYIAIYRAMISWIDTQVGRVLTTLEAQGLRDNTIIVFTADHGDFNFEHGLAKKDLVLVDSLLHIPCIFSWPQGGIQPTVIPEETLTEMVDVLPTLLDLAGVKIPPGVQGTSFAPLLRGETTAHKDAVFAEVCPPYLYCKYDSFEQYATENGGRGRTSFNVPGDFTKSIREAHWRYIWYGTGEEELYDHRNDPYEQKNLADDPAYAAEKIRLKLRLLEWHALSEDPLDVNIRRDLQEKYNNWTPLSIQPGKHEQPGWKETLRMKHLAKPI
jgi:arylsulfatase A-like enzyme